MCRQAERRWVCKLLRGEVIEPPLPPLPQYEAALRQRLESSGEREDGASDAPAAGAQNRGRARSEGARTATAFAGSRMNGVRPPGW